MTDLNDILKAREILNDKKVPIDNRFNGGEMVSLKNTGIWVEFDYADEKTYPSTSESYFVRDDRGNELYALWDAALQVWKVSEIYIIKWLEEIK